MANGAIKNSNANIGVSISGIAGPSGGTEGKPVGTVCFAWADDNGWLEVVTYHFKGDRSEVRNQAVQTALEVLYKELDKRCV